MKKPTRDTLLWVWLWLFLFCPVFAAQERIEQKEISDEYFDSLVHISKTPMKSAPDAGSKHFSPLRTYWYKSNIFSCSDKKTAPTVYIYTGQEALTRIIFTNTEACHYETKFTWKNDTLLEMQVWLGRISYMQFIFDIKKEQITEKTQYFIH